VTGEESPKRKRRRRGKRGRRSAGQGQPATPLKIVDRALHTVGERGAHPSVDAAIKDAEAELEAVRETREREALAADDAAAQSKVKTASEYFDAWSALMLQPRDMEILNWLAALAGKTISQIAMEMLRSSIVKNKVAYREAHGGGGSSSQDILRLTELLPARK
jgi:ABC-type uncharacterized transport system permease subunit